MRPEDNHSVAASTNHTQIHPSIKSARHFVVELRQKHGQRKKDMPSRKALDTVSMPTKSVAIYSLRSSPNLIIIFCPLIPVDSFINITPADRIR